MERISYAHMRHEKKKSSVSNLILDNIIKEKITQGIGNEQIPYLPVSPNINFECRVCAVTKGKGSSSGNQTPPWIAGKSVSIS